MKKAIMLAVLAALAAAGWWVLCQVRAQARNDKQGETLTTEVVRRDIRETIEATGELAAEMSTDVKSEISGRISRLLVEDGQAVTRDQLLLELDKSELESQRQEALRSIESARLRLEQAKRESERLKQLHAKGFVTEKEYQDAQTAEALADNELTIQQTRLQTLDEKLAKTLIRAPHEGIVLNCDLAEGEVIVGATSVSQGTLLMRVAKLERLVVKADINEVDVARLVPDMPAEISFDSVAGLEVTGRVTKVSPSAHVKDNIRVFPVEVSCQSADARVRPGISANLGIPLSEVTNALAVVVSAVFSDEEGKVVFLRQGAEFVKQPVEVGINDARYAEIIEGVTEDDEVALTRPAAFEAERQARKTLDRQAREAKSGGNSSGSRRRGGR